MTIWLLILSIGVATYAMRGAFLFYARPASRPCEWHRWLRFVPPAVLAALVLPALVGVGQPLAPETLDQLLAAAFAALVAWRFQNVLATVASGMGALWGLLWLAPMTSFALPLGVLLLASAGLVLLAARPLVRHRHLNRASRPGTPTLAAPTVTVTPVAEQSLTVEALTLLAQFPAGMHLHCPWCACPLPLWARYCGRCGWPQPAPALAATQPLPVLAGAKGH